MVISPLLIFIFKKFAVFLLSKSSSSFIFGSLEILVVIFHGKSQ